jgi:hypothetical protein
MTITSNIDQVIERVRLLEAELPKILLRALDPTHWQPKLKEAATAAIRRCWEREGDLALRGFYERVTPWVVATVVGGYFDSGAWLKMSVPKEWMESDKGLEPDAARAIEFNAELARHLRAGSPGRPAGRPTRISLEEFVSSRPEEVRNLEQVRQMVVDWVTFEKHWDERDYHADGSPYTPQERAERVLEILGLGDVQRMRAGVQRTPDMDEAAQFLARAIDDWLLDRGDTSPGIADQARQAEANYYGETAAPSVRLAPEVAHEWLTKTLEAWVQTVRRELPDRIRGELNDLRARLRGGVPAPVSFPTSQAEFLSDPLIQKALDAFTGLL